MSIVEIKELIALIKDFLTAIAALLTIFIGIYGIRLWRRELVGKEIYAAAKDLVKESHLVFKAARELREPIHPYEVEPFTESVINNTTEWERWRISETNGYRKRTENFNKILERYEHSKLNLRVLVGSKIYLGFLPFDKLIGETIERVNRYIEVLNDYKKAITSNSPDVISAQIKLYPSGRFDDELHQKTGDAREEGEKSLLAYLHRKSIRG